MTQLRFRGTKVVRAYRAYLLKYPYHQTSEVETPFPTRRPRCPGPGNTTASPLSDLAIRSFHGLIELLFIFFPLCEGFFFFKLWSLVAP